TGKPINLELSGSSMEILTRMSNEILHIIENDPAYAKLDGLETDLPEPRPEMRIEVDREKAELFGLSTSKIGSTIRAAVNGVEASEFRDGKDEYDIVVRLAEQYRQDLSTWQARAVVDEGRQVPLSAVADWHMTEGYGGIRHIDQERV